ncbi:MAG TPA: class I SAM-dependent methyltransferase [Usitatibacter sp.]|nr:class I SAM-dependent methyltransferase [Usitatibacter sp.]
MRTAPRAPITLLPQYWSDERTRRRYLDSLFDGTAGDYDFVENLLGLGSGPWYRRTALSRAGLRPGMHVLDVATGTGLVAREAQRIVGEAGSVVGLDPSAGMLAQAADLRLPLVRGLGERLPFPTGQFDFVSMGFALRHVSDLEGLFREMHRVLKPGGTACILELSRPSSRLVAAPLELFMTRVVPVIAWPFGRRRQARDLMQFFWDTIDACVPPDEVLASLGRAGFPAPRRNVALGMFSDYTGSK